MLELSPSSPSRIEDLSELSDKASISASWIYSKGVGWISGKKLSNNTPNSHITLEKRLKTRKKVILDILCRALTQFYIS